MLGGFHLLMSFLGSIGAVMKGSGIEESIEQIYAENTVQHIISGKAVSRALRAHFLLESSLVNRLMVALIDMEDDDTSEEAGAFDLFEHETIPISDLKSELLIITEKLKSDNSFYNNVPALPVLSKLQDDLVEYKNRLESSSRTAKLWLQYIYYIDVVKVFIRAERTGDWNLYLTALSKTLNLFAATGHINYAKCARLHLQNMLDLNASHSWVYQQFTEGRLHTIRRSERFWAGLWGDLIIEQVMMRSIKSTGGLTRGRGVTESTRQLWLGSLHRCADVHNAMSNLTGAYRNTSEQHIDLTRSRMKRDNEDLKIIDDWFDLHEPFDENELHLKSLSSGLIGDDLNCDDAESVGLQIQVDLDGKCIEEAVIKRNSKVKTFQDLLPTTKIGDKNVYIIPTILFSRLTALANFRDEIEENFCFELTPEPTSLFRQGMMRKPVKSNLRNYILESEKPINLSVKDVCVIDGGMLLHKVHWPKTTFKAVLKEYIAYLKRRYGKFKQVTCVFDGYADEDSTKSQEHHRRSGKKMSADVIINETTKVISQREVFLSNSKNKAQLIQLLCQYLEEEGYGAVQSKGDADVLIVKQALDYAEAGRNVTVMAEDTDILIILIYHWKDNMGQLTIGIEKKFSKKSSKTLSFWNISSLVKKIVHPTAILFAHAWTGCDTTSAIYQKGILSGGKSQEKCLATRYLVTFPCLSSPKYEVY